MAKKTKPIWNKKQQAKVIKYLQSVQCSKDMKKIQAEWEERDRLKREEELEWWKNIRDQPFMLRA